MRAINNQKSDASTTIIAKYTFALLDGNGNRTNITQNEPYAPAIGEGNVTYEYNDKKNRMATVDEGSNGTVDYTYDFDSEGQLKTKTGAVTNSYTFDLEHRLKAISGESTAQFYYDGGGIRFKAVRDGVTTRYIYSPRGTLLAEADSNNNITKYYIYGNGLLAMVTFDSATQTYRTYCYHYNGVGSTVAMTDSSQQVVNKYSYDAFGNIAESAENLSTNDAKLQSQPFRYVGRHGVMTEPNGLYYMQARYYDPKVGRFISEDPTGFEGGDVNLMAYAGNNPVNNIDPSGEATFLWHFIGAFFHKLWDTFNPWTALCAGWWNMYNDLFEPYKSNDIIQATQKPGLTWAKSIISSYQLAMEYLQSPNLEISERGEHILTDIRYNQGVDVSKNFNLITHTIKNDILPGDPLDVIVNRAYDQALNQLP